jgi:hypothetical protein
MIRLALAFAAIAAVASPLAAQTTLFKTPGTVGYSGWAVRSAGDANGDGLGDWIELAYSGYGTATVRSGLDGAPLQSWSGYSYVKIESVAGVGDLNGDACDDLLVGIPLYILELPWQTGSAQVRSGADGSVIYNITPVGISDEFGYAVAGVGDVDHDNVPDFAVGAPESGSGYVRVYSGRTGLAITTFTGGDGFGSSVTGVGDVDGDGTVDIAAGTPYSGGIVNVYSGANFSVIRSFTSGNGLDNFGKSLAGPGDVNQDGYNDILVGAPQGIVAGTRGFARLYSGADGTVLFEAIGAASFDNFGSAVAAAGDLDQDGFPDFAIGNGDTAGTNTPTAKAVKIYSGQTHQLLHVLANPETSPSYTGFGISIDGGFDTNGDGYPELVVGAPYSKAGGTPGGQASGATFVYSFVPGLADYGIGTPGCTGPESMNAIGTPSVGNAQFTLRCNHAPANTTGLGIVCDAQDSAGSDPFGLGFILHLDLFSAVELLTFDLASDAAGVGTAAAAIPQSPFLAGKTYYAQTLWRWDPGICLPSTFGISSSNGLAITIQ